MKIGVLAVQGAFIEQKDMIQKLGVECVELRQKSDLSGINGIIFPGGESTVQGSLLRQLDMLEPLKEMISDGLPTLATCAGLILLAKNIEHDHTVHLGTLPVTVKRNAYGRQLSSFCTDSSIKGFSNFPMIFIRAPYITDVEDNVEILSRIDQHIVAVQYKNQIALSFHPELSKDTRIHQSFLQMC
jgi:5'-phosphate synthase pdxT subunit